MKENVSDFDDGKWLAFVRAFPSLFFVLPVEQRRETMHKSSSFFIIKVRYVFLHNFYANEPISIIFGDYESWDLALSETLISGDFWKRGKSENLKTKQKSRFGSGVDTPSTATKTNFSNRKIENWRYDTCGIQLASREFELCKFSTESEHYFLCISK